MGAPSWSGRSKRPSSTSDSATRLTEWPNSSATSCAVSASSTSVSVTMRPWRIKSLITSTARSDMRLASSWMVIASGRTISRAIFSFWSCEPWPFSRCVRRRNAATERVRSSSPEVALVTVSRPRLRCSPLRGGRGVGTTTFCPGGSASAGRLTTTRRASSSSAAGGRASAPDMGTPGVGGPTRGIDGDCAGSPPERRRRASSSDCRLKLASCARRSSSSRLRASAASRSRRSRASRSRRTPASVSWRRRSSSSCARASISARARASRCSAVKVGRTTPVLGGGGAVGAGRAAPASAGLAGLGGLGVGAAAGVTGAGRTAAAASPGVKIRRLTFSTTTALLRPCEKLCLTVPCSTGRFKCKVAFGGATPTVLSLLPVSLMPIPNHLASQPI